MLYLFGPGNTDSALLVIRLWTGAMMLYHGGLKLFGGMDRFLETVTSKLHLPPLMGWVAALAEFVGGLLIAVGLLARPATVLVAITMLVAAFGAHASDPWSRKEFALCYFVFSVAVLIAGSGKYSLDAHIARRLHQSHN
jgi:putative oxidoreductase